jgi:Transposase C of IS166 homeodomain
LPRDPDILIEMIAGLRAENEKLSAMLETLKRALYGARSEKRDADEAQLAFGLGDRQQFRSNPNGTPSWTESRTGRNQSGRRPRVTSVAFRSICRAKMSSSNFDYAAANG